jgi:myo-inositol-1(or 4)-monophosphatase
VAAGSLLVTEAGGLVGNFTGEADFMDQSECVAGNPRIYAQLVATLAKYSKFAGAGDKANVRQALQQAAEGEAEASAPAEAPRTAKGTLSSKKPPTGTA